jgi:hypothetical protein
MLRPMMLLAALMALSIQAGCQPVCPQLCAENAEFVDSCLEYWEALWPDMGYEDGQEYLDTCNARYGAAIRLSGARAAREIRVGCADDLGAVASSVGCNDYLPNDFELDPTEGDNGIAPRPGGN